MMSDAEKWNEAIRILLEVLMDNHESEYRAEVKTTKCCKELAQIKTQLIQQLFEMKR